VIGLGGFEIIDNDEDVCPSV